SGTAAGQRKLRGVNWHGAVVIPGRRFQTGGRSVLPGSSEPAQRHGLHTFGTRTRTERPIGASEIVLSGGQEVFGRPWRGGERSRSLALTVSRRTAATSYSPPKQRHGCERMPGVSRPCLVALWARSRARVRQLR